MRKTLPMTRGIALVVAGLAASAIVRADEPKAIDFAHDAAPLLKAHCAKCHTDGIYKGSLSLDTRESLLKAEVVAPGKSGESELIARVESDDPDERMPPKGDRLTPAQVAVLRAWIDQGLKWENGFSFKGSKYVAPIKLKREALPEAQGGRNHPIDRIIDAYLAEQKIERPADLDDVAFLRRASLDVVGLLPTRSELEAFTADTSAGKREALIDRLLADNKSYAEHWLSFWNDLLRNDYKGTGYIDGGRKPISVWLYRSLLENKPFNVFVRELISPTPDSEGFIKGIKWRGRINASQVTEIQFSQNVSQVFFGINMKCASCHDSFIDRWKLEDAYGLAAVIADTPLEIHRCDKGTGKTAEAKFLWPELGSIDGSQPREERLAQLARLVTDPDNGRFTRTIVNRIWQRLFGRGVVHPVDVMANEPWSEPLIEYLASYLVDHNYDLRQLMKHIATSKIYQAKSAAHAREAGGDEYVFRGPEVKRMSAEVFFDAIWTVTGVGPEKADPSIEKSATAAGKPERGPIVRASLVNSDLLMRSLGRPNREQVVTTRGDVLTTLQALDLSNGQILTDLLTRGASKMLDQDRDRTPEQRVESLYLQALGRRPTTAEAATALEVLGSPASVEGLADLLWVVFMLPEFQLIR